MRHWLTFLSATGVLVWTAAIGAAAADPYRVPKAGNPALVANPPAGWTVQYTAPNEAMISSADSMAILELEMISDPATAAKPLADVARDVLRRADLSPRWTSTEPESLAGLPGQAFIVSIARDGVPMGTARVVLAKIDASHIARLTEITLLKETPGEEMAALKELVSHLGISSR